MTGRWRISIIVMIALFGLAMAAAGTQGATLKGYVTDEVSEEGIGNAWIGAWNETLEEENNTWSEYGNGYYEFNLSMGDFEFYAERYSYVNHYDNITIDEMLVWYNFTMEPFAKVMGNVTDYVSEEGIDYVSVGFAGAGHMWYYGSSNSTGYYEAYMPMGDYTLKAEETKHLTVYHNISVDSYKFWFNFTMDPLYNVVGYVRDNDTMDPVPWAWLNFESLEISHYFYTSANNTGYYSAWVTPGSNAVMASSIDYIATQINFSADETYFWMNITIVPIPEPDCYVMGYITNGTGAPIEDAWISWSQYNMYGHYDDNESDEEGFYTLWGYCGEDANVHVWADDYFDNGTYLYEIDGPVLWLNFTLRMPFNVTIMGFVTDEEMEPINGSYVQFSGPDWDWNYSDEEGYYVLLVQATGKFMVNAYWQHLDFYGYVTIPYVDVFWYNITLHEMHSGNGTKYNVSGWVYDDDTEDPIAGAMVDAYSDMDSNYTTTNATGWFHMTLWAMDWIDVDVMATGYFAEYEDYGAGNIYDEFWLEPANATKYWVKGYVYDDETEAAIENATVKVKSDVDFNSTTTNATGWYYLEILAVHWIDVSAMADGYFEDWEYEDAENIREDFYLDPIPDNGTVAGYVKNMTGAPIEGINVGLQGMFGGGNGGDNGHGWGNVTDEDGYFEVEGPAVLTALVAMDFNMSYFPYIHAVVIVVDEVTWHNITLYEYMENDTVVEGYVKDSSGTVVNHSEVMLIPTIPGAMMIQYKAYTNETGYYEMVVPNGTYVALTWAHEIDEWYIEYLEVDGDTWYNVTLVAVINETSMEVYFETWEEGTAKMIQRMSGQGDFFSRMMIDMVFGDSDGTVSEEEHDLFLDLMEDEFDMDPEFEEDDSKDDYTVDGLGYFMEFQSSHIYAKGDVVSFSAIEMKMIMSLELNGTITEADTHVIAMNITGDEDDNPFTDFTFYIPTGYWLDSYTAPDGVTVTGVSVLEILANDTAMGWLYMNVTNVGAPDPVVLDDPENVEGTSMDLSWSEFAGTDFSKYTIYKSTKESSIGSPIADITDKGTTEYTVTGLTEGVTYYFVVRVYITSGTYADSNQVSDTTPTVSSPGFEVIVAITYTPESPKEDKTVTVTATITNNMASTVSLTVRFQVDGTEKDSQTLNLTTGSSDTLTFTWKAKKGTHTLTVRAESGADWSLDSEDVSVKKKSSSTPGFEVLAVAAATVVAIAVRRRRY